jgi:hypothetical protein
MNRMNGIKKEDKMGHPSGGKGGTFKASNSFHKAYEFIGLNGITFTSTTGECIHAKRGKTSSGDITIVFFGEKVRHGNVCEKCWGYRNNCSGTHIGQCAEALDNSVI